jgi:hypothetical protein
MSDLTELSADQLATVAGGIDFGAAHQAGAANMEGAGRVGKTVGHVAGAVGGGAGAAYVFPPLVGFGVIAGGTFGGPIGSAVGSGAGYLYGAGRNIYNQLRGR